MWSLRLAVPGISMQCTSTDSTTSLASTCSTTLAQDQHLGSWMRCMVGLRAQLVSACSQRCALMKPAADQRRTAEV